jgi:hypothetical protein
LESLYCTLFRVSFGLKPDGAAVGPGHCLQRQPALHFATSTTRADVISVIAPGPLVRPGADARAGRVHSSTIGHGLCGRPLSPSSGRRRPQPTSRWPQRQMPALPPPPPLAPCAAGRGAARAGPVGPGRVGPSPPPPGRAQSASPSVAHPSSFLSKSPQNFSNSRNGIHTKKILGLRRYFPGFPGFPSILFFTSYDCSRMIYQPTNVSILRTFIVNGVSEA